MANKYFRKVATPVVSTETTVYTVPTANTAILRSLRATNAGASSGNITVTQYSAGDVAPHYLLKAKSLSPSTTTDVFNGVPCVLEEGDVLKVTASMSSCIFYLSYLEIDRN